MESVPQFPQLEKNNIESGEQAGVSSKRILRPGMLNKAKAALGAAIVGVVGAGYSPGADAQVYTYATPVYGNQGYVTQSNGVVSVPMDNKKALGQVAAGMVVNGVLRSVNSPVSVGMQNGQPTININMNHIPTLQPVIEPQAVSLLRSFNYAIERGVIYDLGNPTIRLNIGPRTTALHIKKSQFNDSVIVDMAFKDGNGATIMQKFSIGKDANGRVVPIQIAGPRVG